MDLFRTCTAFSNSQLIRKYTAYPLAVHVFTANRTQLNICTELHNSSIVNLHNSSRPPGGASRYCSLGYESKADCVRLELHQTIHKSEYVSFCVSHDSVIKCF